MSSQQGEIPKEDSVSLVERLINIKPALDFPQFRHSELVRSHDTTLRLTIMKDAWKDAGIDIEDPGGVQQYYFEEEGVLVVDLNQERERTGD